MISVEMKYGKEEYEVLGDLLLDSPKEQKGRKIWKVLLIIFGVFELGYGFYTIITSPGAMTGFCLVTGAVALFLAFGGERFLLRSAVRRRTRKLNQNNAGGSRQFTFDEELCTITTESGTGEYGWDAFTAFGEISHYLWIRRNDNKYVLIDMKKLSKKDGNLLRQYCGKITEPKK